MKAPYCSLKQQKQGTGMSGIHIKDKGKVCLTSNQTRFIYKKIEKRSCNYMMQEMGEVG